jgi:hypothetical protein
MTRISNRWGRWRYRFTLAWPDTDGLLAVLNEKISLLDAIVIDRKLVGVVAD